MTKTKAVIFDMDGVIVDSEPLHARAFLEVFEEMGYGKTHGMDFPAYYGRSDRALWLDFVEKHHPPQPLPTLAEWKQRRFIEMLKRERPIFQAVVSLLEKLAPIYGLAIASGSGHQVIDEVLAMSDLRRLFSFVVSVQDVPRGKPAPDVFLRAAALLEVEPSQCWVVEDAPAGVEAALSAGMRVIAITNSLPANRLANATHVVNNYEQIERILL